MVASDEDKSSEDGNDHASRLAARKARKRFREEGGNRWEKAEIKVRVRGPTRNGFNRSTGERNRRLTRKSRHHFAPICPSRGKREKMSTPATPVGDKPSRPPSSSIAVDLPISVQNDGFPVEEDARSNCEQCFRTTLDLGGQFLCVGGDCVVALNTGAPANSVCCELLGNHFLLVGKQGLPRVSTYPSRFRFGDGRIGGVRYAADITAGIAGRG